MRQLVTIQKIEDLRPIAGADKIEVASVKGWKVVVLKNQFKINDLVLYFEIDSFLPVKPEYEFLLKGSKPKKMLVDGKEVEGIRLRTVKLRGQISQGLIMPIPNSISPDLGVDVSEALGIIKYEQPIPACLSGRVKGMFPCFIPKTDEERIQNIPEIFNGYYATEKLDGSSVTYYKKDGVFGVCSRNLELLEGDTIQWKLARELGLQEKLYDDFAIQGEVVGAGIQKNPYKLMKQKVYFFNAYNIKTGKYLEYQNFKEICETLGLEIVPVINENYPLPSSVDEMLERASGKSLLNPEIEREGLVIRKKNNVGNERVSFKAINNDYLLFHDKD